MIAYYFLLLGLEQTTNVIPAYRCVFFLVHALVDGVFDVLKLVSAEQGWYGKSRVDNINFRSYIYIYKDRE